MYVEVFKADRFEEVSLSDWLAHSPVDMVAETLVNIDSASSRSFQRTDQTSSQFKNWVYEAERRVGVLFQASSARTAAARAFVLGTDLAVDDRPVTGDLVQLQQLKLRLEG